MCGLKLPEAEKGTAEVRSRAFAIEVRPHAVAESASAEVEKTFGGIDLAAGRSTS